MAAQKGVTVATADFPLYTIRMVGDSHFLVAGGGGQAKTGVPNAVEIYELRGSDGSCIASKVKHHETSVGAVMNGCVISNNKDFTVALGIDSDCHIYKLRSKLVTPKVEGNVTDGIRKRKGNFTDSDSHKHAIKMLTYDFDLIGSVKTDFGPGGGFQKTVHFSPDISVMLTGGSDGMLRAWKFPDLHKLYEVKSHTDEIDDLHLSPAGNQIVTVSRDCKAYVWNTKDGSKHKELFWMHRKDARYRFRSCRFAEVMDEKNTYYLYTSHIPHVRGHKPLPCYLTKWDTTKFVPSLMKKTGIEVLSSFAVSDRGIYIGVGTISGSVSVYIAFSLQKLYDLKEVHNIFVTGLEFAPSTDACQSITGNHDLTMFSISADKQVKMHQVANRQTVGIIWIILGLMLSLYMIYWAITTLGL